MTHSLITSPLLFTIYGLPFTIYRSLLPSIYHPPFTIYLFFNGARTH